MAGLAEAGEAFLAHLVERSKIRKGYTSPNTQQTYRRILGKFHDHMAGAGGSVELAEVRRNDVVSFLAAQRDRGASSGTIALYLSCLRSFFKWAHLEWPGTGDATEGIEGPAPERRRVRAMSEEDVAALLAHLAQDARARKRDLAIFGLIARTGARVSEICAMDLDDLRISDDAIVVSLLGKGNKRRRVTIPLIDAQGELIPAAAAFAGRMRGYVKRRLREMTPDPGHEQAVFLTNRGRRIQRDHIQGAFRHYMKELGLKDYTPHTLRHYFVTKLLAQHVDVATVSELVGHANPQVTMAVYAHTSQERMEEAMRKVF